MVEQRRKQVDKLYRGDLKRFPRKIDATYFSDLVDIICNAHLYNEFFMEPLKSAFPCGRQEAEEFLRRLTPNRNKLSHGNELSDRDAERLLCYSNDIIDSLRLYYERKGIGKDYNVPLILSVTLWTGDVFRREQCERIGGHIMLNLSQKREFDCREGDTITLEVEVDSAYDATLYDVEWRSLPSGGHAIPYIRNKAIVLLQEEHVCQEFSIQCIIKAKNKKWYRLGSSNADDMLLFYIRVLPIDNKDRCKT